MSNSIYVATIDGIEVTANVRRTGQDWHPGVILDHPGAPHPTGWGLPEARAWSTTMRSTSGSLIELADAIDTAASMAEEMAHNRH